MSWARISVGCSVLSLLLLQLGCTGPGHASRVPLSGPPEPAASPAELPAPSATGSAPPIALAAEPRSVSGGALQPSDAVLKAVSAKDRTEQDRALDPGRDPARLLTFFGLRPGLRVAEIGAGGGYTTELLARVVGPKGAVYAQNSRFVLERFAEGPLTERLKKPLLEHVTRVDSEFDDPFPKGLQPLDLVLNVLFYHDTVWQGTDRARMNRAIYGALKPGGIYGIVDHSAKPGAQGSVAKELHRIEESLVIEEIAAAGFRLLETSDLLRNPADSRDWNASPRAAAERRGQSDRFVLKFQKPEPPDSKP